MSGGHFDYKQFTLSEMADEIERIISANAPDDREEYYRFSKDTIEKFKECVLTLKLAETMTHRIDWLLSGDDGEETFHERWNEEIKKINE